MIRLLVFLCGSVSLASASACLAAEASAIRLGEPMVTRLDWNIRNMTIVDLNKNGANDIVVVNNDRSRIELLFQRVEGEEVRRGQRRVSRNRWEPEFEDGLFRRESLVTGHYVFAVRVGDFNGDGINDIAYTGNDVPLTIRFGREDGTFSDAVTYRNFETVPWISSLQVVSGEGGDDLVVLGKDRIMYFPEITTENLGEPVTYRITAENPYGLRIRDLDGDGLPDLFYQVRGGDSTSARIRLGLGRGRFGPEVSLPLDVYSAGLEFDQFSEEGAATFYFIRNRTLLIEKGKLDFRVKEAEGLLDNLNTYAFPTVSRLNRNPPAVVGDFNGDGLLDIVVANPGGAELLYYEQKKDGFVEPQSYPSLSGISSLAVFNEEGRDRLIVLSEVENIMGVSRYSEGRFTFPEFIRSEETPVLATVLEGHGLIVVERTNLGQFVLTRRGPFHSEEPVQKIELEGMNRNPTGVITGDLNRDGRNDLIILGQREPSRVFVTDEEGLLSEIAKESSVRKSLLNNIERAQLAFLDIDGKGEQLIVAGNGFARAISVDEEGELVVVDQFNARSSDDRLRVPFLADLDGDGKRDLMFLTGDGKHIQQLKQDDQGVYRFYRLFDIDTLEAIAAFPLEVSGVEEIVFPARDRLMFLRPGFEGIRYESRFTYESDLQDVKYTGIGLGDLTGDSKNEVIAVDTASRIMDFLVEDEESNLRSTMHFTVFDTNIHYQGRRGGAQQPSEWSVADVTGDGLNDLILSVHDRILVYPQMPAE